MSAKPRPPQFKPEDLLEYLPQGVMGHVLITSQYSVWGEMARPLPISVWPREDSVKYILQRTEEANEADSRTLAEQMGDLPLALAQATGYINSNPVTIKQYLELFLSRKDELWQEERPPSDYESTVATTWNLALEKLPQESTEILILCAFLAPDDIPWELFDSGATKLPETLTDVFADQIQRNRFVKPLTDYSLVEATPSGISVHRLVQLVVRHRLNVEGTKKKWALTALYIVNEAYPYQEDNPNTWPLSGKLLSHIYACLEHSEDIAPDTVGNLLNGACLYLRKRGQFYDAKQLSQKALSIELKTLSPDHPNLARTYSNLALDELELGNLDDALSLINKAIAINEKCYGVDDLTT